MCDVSCILVYDCSNYTNICTSYFFITYTYIYASICNKEVTCAYVGIITAIILKINSKIEESVKFVGLFFHAVCYNVLSW
jgi:hypothetical protein